jgi:hypothetical protein
VGAGERDPVKAPCAVLVSILVAGAAAAQEQRGSIEGRVHDPSGAGIPGARVEAVGETGLRASVPSDADGRYRFHSLPPGRYTVEASSVGRSRSIAGDVRLALGQILELHFALPAAGPAESVAVIAETPLIDEKQSTRAASLREEEIARLPRGRDVTSVVSLGVSANGETKAGGVSVDGASGAENRFVVDGMDTTAILTGIPGMEVVTDFVDEVQVKYSGFAAEHGGATGGVVNVVSRRGTDRWKGDAGLYYSGNRLEAAPRPTLRLRPSDATRAEYVRFTEDNVDRWEPGFALGGPLRSGLWLFASYQPSFSSIDRTVTFAADGQAHRFTQRLSTHHGTANLSARLGKTWARVAFNMSPREEKGKLPELNGLGNPLENLAVTATFPNYALSANVDYGVGSKLMLSARGGYWYSNYHEPAIHRGPLYSFQTSNLGMPGVPADLQGGAGRMNALGNFEATRDMFSRTSLQADGTWFVAAAGSHAVKAGLQLDRVGNDVEVGESGNIVGLFWGEAFDGQRGPFGYYQLISNSVVPERGSIVQGDVGSDTLGVFVQDAWTIRRRLTLNLGVRAEREEVPSFAGADLPPVAIHFGFAQKVAPRLGAAWDVTGSGRWKAYASWGLFYDTMKYALPRGLFGADKTTVYWFTLDTPDWPNLVRPGCPPACPGALIDGPVDQGVPANAPGEDGIDPDLRPFRLREAVAGGEHQLSGVFSVGLRYVRKSVDAAVEDVGGFASGTGSLTVFVGNPGLGRAAQTGFGPPYPKAVRDYDGLELTLDKRMADNWSARAGYLWSRLSGNYSGLAHSDENGRRAPNFGRAFDHPFMAFDEAGRPVLGVLATDRTHQFKAQGTYDFRFGTTVGAHFRLMSGLPVSREVAVVRGSNFPVLYRGRNSDGRTPTLSQLDLYARHEIKVGDGKRIQLAVNVINVLDRDTAVSRNSRELAPGNALTIAPADFFRGFDTQQLIAAQRLRRNPLFLMDNAFQPPREARVSAKLLF